MPVQDFPLVGSYNNQRVSSIDAERSVNVFEYIDVLGKKPRTLINTSGLINTGFLFSGAEGGSRADFVFNGIQYLVFGSIFYSITTSGIVAALGTLVTNSGYVSIDANTFQVALVDGHHIYIWDTMALTFVTVTDPSAPAIPIDICYLDGFFVVANGNTNNFQLSSFDQGLVWGSSSNTFTADDTGGNNWLILSSTASYQTGVPVDVSTTGSLPMPLNASTTYYVIQVDATHIREALTYDDAINGNAIVLTSNGSATNTITGQGQLQQGAMTTHPGTIVACRTLHRRLFLFSQNFTEVWENAGIGTNLPFRRNNSLLMEYGTPCVGSIDVSFDIMIFLSQTKDGLGPVMQVSGAQAFPISTRALDFQLSAYAALQQISDCESFLIKENGIIFYRMNFTAANHTFVYDVTLSDPTKEEGKLWHEEEVLNGDRHPAQTHSYFNGINYVGHYSLPVLYQVDSQTYSNDGQAIRRMRISKAIVPPAYQRMRIDRFQIDLLQGNIAEYEIEPIELDLGTEDLNLIETEDGNNIELEQSGQGGVQLVTPNVFMSYSKDGGQTYGYVQQAPMGMLGNRTFRTLWRKLGTVPRGQAFVIKIEFYDEVPFVVLGAAWAMDVLPE